MGRTPHNPAGTPGSPEARSHAGGIDGAIVRGGVPSGLTEDGSTIPILAKEPGEWRVADLDLHEIMSDMLLELRAVRLGLERQLNLDPGTLLEEAEEDS